jgi:hypothetical protein
MKLNRILFVLMVFYAVNCFAQDIKWTRIEFEKNVSVSVPEGFLVDMGAYYLRGKGRIIYQNSDFLIELDVYDYADPKRAVRNFVSDAWSVEKAETNKVIARRFIYNESPVLDFVLVGTDKYYYKFRIQTENTNNPKVLRFIDSIKIEGKSAFPQNTESAVTDETTVSFSNLKTSSEIKFAESRNTTDINEYKKASSIDEIKKQDAKAEKYSRLPFIVGKSNLFHNLVGSMIARKDLGKVLVKVVLKADGNTGEVAIFSTAEEKITRGIFKQVKKRKFVPAQIDGKNADYIEIIECDLDFSSGKVLN